MRDSESDKFMLKEYERISEAHFNTSNQISSFFKYYLTLMSVPGLFVIYINKDNAKVQYILSANAGNPSAPDLGWLCVFISIIGLFLTFYLTKLKFDHILYARTVNGIRKYYVYRNVELKQYLVLPINVEKPSFVGFGFGSLILVNGIVNSSYIAVGLMLLNVQCHLVYGAISLVLHIVGYLVLGRIEERKVLKLQ